MTNIRIKDLPIVTEPQTTDKIVMDDPTEGTRSITIQDFLTTTGARFFVQTSTTATTYPNGSLWIDSDSTNLDLYQLVSAVWTDTGLDMKGATGASYVATSTTSNAIANSGSKTFTVQSGLAYTAGARVRAADASNPTVNYMEGVVTSYSGTSLVFTADLSAGSGTLTSWKINLAGDKGTVGAAGPGYAATSVTSNSIASSGTKTFTTQSGLAYAAGVRVRAADASLPSTNYMEGVVSSYSGTSLVFTADLSAGSGTLTSWVINVTGQQGPQGTPGSGTIASATTHGVGIATGASAMTSTAVMTDAQLLIGQSAADPTPTSVTGDVTISKLGVTAIGALKVLGSMIAAATIDLTTKVTGILSGANGGTGNGFFAVSGPATSLKTFAFPNASDTIAALGTANVWTKQQSFTPGTLISGSSISWDVSIAQIATVVLGVNATMAAVTNAAEGACYGLIPVQDGTGSRTLAYTTSGAGSFDFGATGAPTLTTTLSKGDIIWFQAVTIAATRKLRYCGIQKGFA